MTFNGWKEVVLEEVSCYGDEKIPSDEVTLDNYISTENMLPNKSGVGMASGLPTTKSVRRYKKGDILLSNIRPYFKKIWFVTKNGGCSNDVLVIKNKDEKELDKKYLYYTLLQDNFFDYVTATSKGTKMPRGDKSAIMNYGIMLPPLYEQKAIANILSTLDEKIETNNKINEKLEEMAQALFKHWFVDFEFPNENGEPYKSSGGEMVESELGMIPKGWEIKELNDVTEKANTGADAIKRAPIVDYDTGIKCVRVGDLSRGRTYKDWGYCEITEKDYKKFALQKNDIIISRTANIGLNIFVFEDMRAVFNNGLIRLKIKKSYEPLFIFALINSKAYFDYIFRINGETSTRPNMKIGYLLKYKFALPPNGIINSFVDVIKNIYAKVNLNNEENSRLIDIRDTLLPKLMSGEIRVPLDDEVLSEKN